MNDQASGLRKMKDSQQVKVIAVSGGKGGVGKTNVSLNTAIALGQLGKRVLVLDADLGLANVDVMLGLRVKRNLSHVLSGECELDDIIIDAKSGVSGAGKKLNEITQFCTVNENIFAYNPFQHRHMPEIEEKIKLFKPKFIVNFAAQGMVAESWNKPEDWYQTNVVSQVKLHNCLRQLDFIENYLHFSTPEVYGSTEGWIKESYHLAPNTPYAASRAACDLHLMTFFRNYDFPVTFTRAANVFGEGQQLYRIITKTILSGLLRKKLIIEWSF